LNFGEAQASIASAWNTLDQPGFVQELDVATLKPRPRIEVGHFPLNMTATPDAKTAIVDTTADGAIAVVDRTNESNSQNQDR
jgi:DNA-binding beta-propeller fold protein YncE